MPPSGRDRPSRNTARNKIAKVRTSTYALARAAVHEHGQEQHLAQQRVAEVLLQQRARARKRARRPRAPRTRAPTERGARSRRHHPMPRTCARASTHIDASATHAGQSAHARAGRPSCHRMPPSMVPEAEPGARRGEIRRSRGGRWRRSRADVRTDRGSPRPARARRRTRQSRRQEDPDVGRWPLQFHQYRRRRRATTSRPIPHFCKSALARYTPADFIAMVERYRIAYHEKELGQLFCDDSSKQIVRMLLDECAATRACASRPAARSSACATATPASTSTRAPAYSARPPSWSHAGGCRSRAWARAASATTSRASSATACCRRAPASCR